MTRLKFLLNLLNSGMVGKSLLWQQLEVLSQDSLWFIYFHASICSPFSSCSWLHGFTFISPTPCPFKINKIALPLALYDYPVLSIQATLNIILNFYSLFSVNHLEYLTFFYVFISYIHNFFYNLPFSFPMALVVFMLSWIIA